MKKFIATLLAAAMTFALIACAKDTKQPDEANSENTGTEQTDKKFTIAFANSNASYPYMVKLLNRFTKLCDENGFELLATDAAGEVSTQNDQIENFCAMGVDFIITIPINYEASVTAMNTCRDAGIPVIAMFNHVNVDRESYPYYVFVGSDNVEAGRLTGAYCAENLKENANVCIILGRGGINQTEDVRNGIQQGLFDVRSDVALLDEQNTDDYRADAVDLAENWMQAYQSQGVDCILGYCDDSILGAIQAIKSAGRDTDDFLLCGRDASEEACLSIINGDLDYTLLQDAFGQCDACIDIAKGLIDGKSIGDYDDVIIPYVEVTDENVDQIMMEQYNYTQDKLDELRAAK